VLDGRGDHVTAAARFHDAGERPVVGLGAAAGEDDLVGEDAEARRDLGARRLDHLLRHAAAAMAGRRVPPALAQRWQHRLDDAGVHRRGGVVVEVDEVVLRRVHLAMIAILRDRVATRRGPG